MEYIEQSGRADKQFFALVGFHDTADVGIAVKL